MIMMNMTSLKQDSEELQKQHDDTTRQDEDFDDADLDGEILDDETNIN